MVDIEQLTVEEKAALCTGASAWTTVAIDRVGLPALVMADGPHGVRRVADTDSMAIDAAPSTCFPTASSLACSWDPELAREVGRAIGREAIALGVDVVLGPGVNIKRSPLCGRNFEYFSEDPLLSGELAVAWIEGVQSQGIGVSLKHFAANNQETRRMSVSSEVDERTLREIYLPAFEAAVTRAQPWTVMCAYNKVNGTYASEHHELLTRILRHEWGFDGFTVSDWGAVHDRPQALAAGLDLEMPGPRPRRTQVVIDAVRSGALDEEVLDAATARITNVIARAGATPKGGEFDVDAHHALARKVAARGMVLLKNDCVLPLRPEGRIAVIGRSAQVPHFQGGGSSHINATREDVPFAELAQLAGEATLVYAEGYPADDASRLDLITEAERAAQDADVAVLFVALPEWKETEGRDRTNLELTDQQVALIDAVCAVQERTVIVLNNGSAVSMSRWINGPAAVLEAWMAGQAGGGAVADVLFGVAEPTGRLAETFPLALEDTPAHLDFPGDTETVRYGEGLFVGYRWYDARARDVLFPFGHGLGYATFEYTNAHASGPSFAAADGMAITVDVTNTGERSGTDVVQVYVSDRESGLRRPEKELKGFACVGLASGETREVTVQLDTRAFAFYDPRHRRWVTEDGDFDIRIAASASDIRATLAVRMHSSPVLPPLVDEWSPVGDWLSDPIARPLMEGFLRDAKPYLVRAFSSDADGEMPDTLDEYFRQLPLFDALEFGAKLGGPDPDRTAADLLEALQAAAGSSDAPSV